MSLWQRVKQAFQPSEVVLTPEDRARISYELTLMQKELRQIERQRRQRLARESAVRRLDAEVKSITRRNSGR